MKIEQYELILMLEEYGEYTLLIDEDGYVCHKILIKDINIIFVVRESANILWTSVRPVDDYFLPKGLDYKFRGMFHKTNIHCVKELLDKLVTYKASLIQPW